MKQDQPTAPTIVVLTPAELLALVRAAVREELAVARDPANDHVPEPAARPMKRARAPRAVTRPPGESDELSARLASNALRRSGFTGRKVE